MIRPSSYCSCRFATRSSYFLRIAGFDGGTTTSFLEIVMPACVAKRKPRSLNASSTWEMAEAPKDWTSVSTNAVVSRLRRDLLMNVYWARSKSSPIVSSRARSILSLKMMRPTVVAMWPPSTHSAR